MNNDSLQFAVNLFNSIPFRQVVKASTAKQLWKAAYSKSRYEVNNRWYDLPEHKYSLSR